MRLRIMLLVMAASSLVLVSFLVPLALVLRNQVAARAVNSATAHAQSIVPLVARLPAGALGPAIAVVNGRDKATPLTVWLPGATAGLGAAPLDSGGVSLAHRSHSFSAATRGGDEVLVTVPRLPVGADPGLPAGTAVIRAFVPDSQLRQGVARTWLELLGIGIGVLGLSVALADRLARSLVGPLAAVARAADSLAAGDLSARAELAGPPEVRRVGSGLNRLARRIGELLAYERETVADVSHRLRTPMTALQIDAESLRDHVERARMLIDVDALERTVDEVIRTARKPARIGLVTCDAVGVVAERAAFWRPLAEDTSRVMTVELADGELPVRVTSDDLRTCMDVLLENVFAHTPDGSALAIRLSPRAAGGAWLVVADSGPGFGSTDPTERGKSGGGSTGLGLDIVRRIAEASGGAMTIGRSPSGGGSVTMGLGSATRPVDRMRGHRRARSGAPREPASYFWHEGE